VGWSEGIVIAINLIVFSLRPTDLKSPDTSRSETFAGRSGDVVRWSFIGKQRRENKNVPFILVAVGEHTAAVDRGKK